MRIIDYVNEFYNDDYNIIESMYIRGSIIEYAELESTDITSQHLLPFSLVIPCISHNICGYFFRFITKHQQTSLIHTKEKIKIGNVSEFNQGIVILDSNAFCITKFLRGP